MFKSLAFFVVAVLSGPCVDRISAQTNYIDSTRSNVRTASSEAKAEAKRLYKEGLKYGSAGLIAQAAQMFEQAVKLDPQHADAHFSMGHAYFDLHQYKNAIRGFERAYELNPKDLEARDMLALARTLVNQGPQSAYTPREQTPPKAESIPVAMSVKQPSGTPGKTESPSSNNVEANKVNAAASELALTKIYRVGPNDVLDIRINDSSSPQSTLFTITPAGALEHPLLVEPLPVGGLTVDEISSRLEAELKRRALVDNPKVSVGVRDYASHAILVSGLVKDSGTKILRREAIPLYVVIADAQALPEAARVNVVRSESNESFQIELGHATDMNLLVRPGDVITVLPNVTEFVYIGGEVKSPGEKTYRRGLTLTQAIIAAGGVTPKAKEARLGRDDGKGFLVVTRYKLKEIESGKEQDPLVKPGDRITIRE